MVEIQDPGMPPREEALEAMRELAPPPSPASEAAERRSLLERIPIVAWIVVATAIATGLVAWLIART